MGCCVSKKLSEPPGAEAHRKKVVEARDLPPPEEEKVKEVLSETPSVKPRPKPKRVAGAVVAPAAEKNAKVKDGVAKVKGDGGGGERVRRAARPARSLEEKSEAASESSAATTATGPDRSPSKPPRYRQGATSGEPRRARRDRAASAAPGGRASPSPPPPRRDTGRRSPSPAAKRSSQDQRREAAASCAQRKPPVPARPCGRNPTPRRAQEAPTQPTPAPAQSLSQGSTHCASPPTPQAPVQQEDAASCGDGVDGAGDGEGKESLENPLVSMECFIFL